MRALQYYGPNDVRLETVPEPRAGSGQVLLRVDAAGICHSDLHLADGTSIVNIPGPFTLGHEIAGTIVEAGLDVDGSCVGAQVAVYAPTGCFKCHSCQAGAWNYCDRRATLTSMGLGFGEAGGMAEYVAIDVSRAVPTHGVDACAAAVLTDAGLTSYHAVAAMQLPHVGQNVIVVIGVGGLGHLAIQILKHLYDAVVVGVDRSESARRLATASGADYAVAPGELVQTVEDVSRGRGASSVVDIVGSASTFSLAHEVLGTAGELIIVGSEGAPLDIGKRVAGRARGLRYRLPVWGTRPELEAVIALARDGVLRPEIAMTNLDQCLEKLHGLADSPSAGRVVVQPSP